MKLSLGVGGPTRGESSSESMATTRSEASESSSRSSTRGRDRGGGFYGFTRAQLEELSLQLLIFNRYLASGQTALPPPTFQLLLPIFPSSFHHSSFHLLLHYPLFGLQQQRQPPTPPPPCLDLGHPGLDQRERMDQPGRCRRTDGKRWRCTKEVIPNEKYCEKHMHRGCGRSRKLVESSMEKPSSSSSHPSNVLNLNSADSGCPANVLRDNKLEMQPGGKERKIEDPKERRGNDGVIKIAFKLASSALSIGKMEITDKQHKLGKGNGCVYERAKEENIVAVEKLPSAGKDDKSSNGKVKAERSEIESSNNKSKKSNGMGLEFSPKSVLQQGHSLSAVNQNNTHSIVVEDFEHMRCRRTDGKRWRCRKEVIAEDQKYCAKHMHRGAKKRPVGSQGAECGGKTNPFALVKRANKLVVGFDSNLKS